VSYTSASGGVMELVRENKEGITVKDDTLTTTLKFKFFGRKPDRRWLKAKEQFPEYPWEQKEKVVYDSSHESRRVKESLAYNPSLRLKPQREESIDLQDYVVYKKEKVVPVMSFQFDHKENVLDGEEYE
jgi:hypothetical protein